MKKELNAPWYSSYYGVRKHIDYPDHSLYEQLNQAVNKYPYFTALNYFGTKYFFKDLLKKVDLCAKSLKKVGIKKGDVITICMPNTPEAIIMFYAVNKVGAISNIIHPLSAENEIKYALELTKSKMILAIDLAWDKIKNILKDTKVKKSIIVSVKDSMPLFMSLGYYVTQGKNVGVPNWSKDVIPFREFIELGKEYKCETNEYLKGNDDAVILYSGGTTGTAKGIVLTNLNFNAVAMQSYEACSCLTPGMSVLSIMPIFHGFGLGICFHTALTFGVTAIMLPQFSAKTFDKLLKKYKPNIIVGVPTLYEALLNNNGMKDMDLSFIKCALSGGDNLSPSSKEKIDKFLKEHNCDVQIREGYGLTECVAASCLTPLSMYKKGSIGVPIPDMYFKIVKVGTIDEVPFGEEGEIVISGPTVMKGYFDNKKETKEVLKKHDDGHIWLHTGDLGYMDSDGFVYYKQRIKRMIISSGYNLYPSRIESVIEELPFVVKSCVIGVPHPYKIQVAKAFVVLKDGIDKNETLRNEIYDHCVKNLAKYSLPYEIEFIDELPKTKVNKVDYRKLEEMEKEKIKKS